MFGEEIVSDSSMAAGQSDLLKASVASYGSFSPETLADATVGVPGSDTHDALASSIKDAMHAWAALVYSDADAIEATGLAFSEEDGTLASKLLGIGR